MHRKSAYTWLARQLDIGVNDCHIAMFNLETCRLVVTVAKSRQSGKTNCSAT